VATINAGGVALTDDVVQQINTQAAAALPPPNQPTPQIVETPIAGGVSAVPIDASTYLQITIPANPTFPNPAGGVTILLTAKILTPNGTITNCLYTYTFNISSGLLQVADLAPGYLLSVAVTCGTAGIPDCALYVVVGLLHQPNTGQPLDALLVASYVSSAQPCGWPEGILRTVSDGNGVLTLVEGPNPGPGNPAYYQVADEYFQLQSVQATLTTGVAVANRDVYVQVSNPLTFSQNVSFCVNTQTAGSNVTYIFSQGIASASLLSGAVQLVPLPQGINLSLGMQIIMGAANLQGADSFSVLQVMGQAWL
jgi:hypothetical protein